MPAKSISVVIEKPVSDVFDYMNDVAREPEWQPQLVEAEQSPPGPATTGSQRRYVSNFLGRRVENTYVIRTYEPNRRLVLETTDDSVLDATTDIRWEPVEGGTKVTMSVDGRPKGALRFVPRALVEGTFESELKDTLARLKARLEQPD